MKYRCYVLLSLVSGACIRPLYVALECLWSTNASKLYAPNKLQTNFRSHARPVPSTENYFPKHMFGRLVLNLLKFRDTITMLH